MRLTKNGKRRLLVPLVVIASSPGKSTLKIFFKLGTPDQNIAGSAGSLNKAGLTEEETQPAPKYLAASFRSGWHDHGNSTWATLFSLGRIRVGNLDAVSLFRDVCGTLRHVADSFCTFQYDRLCLQFCYEGLGLLEGFQQFSDLLRVQVVCTQQRTAATL